MLQRTPQAEISAPTTRDAGDRSGKAKLVILLLLLALAVAAALSLATGASDASAIAVLWDWALQLSSDGGQLSARDALIIYDIRLPRMVMGLLIGSSLAVCGATMQGLFRNPLADPGIVGVSAGAGLGAVTMIVLSSSILAPVASLLGVYACHWQPLVAGWYQRCSFTGYLHGTAARLSRPCCWPVSHSARWQEQQRVFLFLKQMTSNCVISRFGEWDHWRALPG